MSNKGYFDLREFKLKHRKDQIIRNCVDPNVGKYILDCVTKQIDNLNKIN